MSKRVVIAVFMLLLAVLLLTSCGKPVEAGTITKKWYKPESTYYMPVKTGEICNNINGVRTCTPIYTQMPYTEEERWVIRIEECTDKCRHTDYKISQEKYETLTVGEFFTTEG